jgi:hypothetical protein
LRRSSATLASVLLHCSYVLGPRHILLRPPVPNYRQILHTRGLTVLVLVHAKLPRQNSTCTLHPRGRVTSCTHSNFARHQLSRAPLAAPIHAPWPAPPDPFLHRARAHPRRAMPAHAATSSLGTRATACSGCSSPRFHNHAQKHFTATPPARARLRASAPASPASAPTLHTCS